jgi:hypothetical protein
LIYPSLFSFVLSMPYAAHVSNCSLLIYPSLFSFVLSLPYAAHVFNNEQLETWAA